jgi:hypothetical protein
MILDKNQAMLIVTGEDDLQIDFQTPEISDSEYYKSHLFVAALAYLAMTDDEFVTDVIVRAAKSWTTELSNSSDISNMIN